MIEGPEPRYPWRETWPGEGHEDYAAWDGDRQFGRISFESAGATKGKWRWSIAYIRGNRANISPHNGWADNARMAAMLVEDTYEQMMQASGMAYGAGKRKGPAVSDEA